MSRAQLSQPQRTQNNPLKLGTFSSTSLRYLKGTLGPKNQVVGRADTWDQSNGGFGGGTYNHWYQIDITSPAWIIVTKGPPRPKYIQVSAYDLNKTPIQGEAIFDADSVHSTSNGTAYVPYLDTVMSTQSDLYNQFSALRIDRGDERYYPLTAGRYLICVSTTRNEPLSYEVGVVVEFAVQEGFFELEDNDGSVFIQETDEVAESVVSPVIVNTTVPPPGAFTSTLCEITSSATVTVSSGATWMIGFVIPEEEYGDYKFTLEPGDDAYYDTIHDHSLSEWRDAWEATHQDTDKFPDLFIPLTNRP